MPLICAEVGWIIWRLMLDQHLAVGSPEGAPVTLSEVTTIISGVIIVGSLITPDFSRYCKKSIDIFRMNTSSVIIGQFGINAIAIVIAHSLGKADVVAIMTNRAGWLGLINVIEMLARRKLNYFSVTLCLGMMGTALSVFLSILPTFLK